jgi:hypothetical protein
MKTVPSKQMKLLTPTDNVLTTSEVEIMQSDTCQILVLLGTTGIEAVVSDMS